MPDLMMALRNADAAGDEDAAKRIAAMIRAQQTGAAIEPISQAAPAPQPEPTTQQEDPSFIDKAIGAAENVGSIVSGSVAEPLAGLSGIAAEIIPGGKTGAEQVESTREALTYQPKTDVGQEYQQAIGETLEPVAEAVSSVEKGLGNAVLEATGSAELAAIAHTLPTAALTALGVKGLKGSGAAKGITKEILSEATPDKADLKNFSRAIYKEIDDAGAVVKPETVSALSRTINNDLKSAGYNKRTAPKIRGIIEELSEMQDRTVTLSEVDTLRKIAGNAAKSIEPSEQMLASRAIEKIDSFMDNLKDNQLSSGSAELGPKYRDARKAWGKARKLEVVEEIMEKAKNAESGEENGIRQGFTRLLNNKKRLKGFTKSEVDAMKDISRGGPVRNTLKKLGKLGFGEGKAGSLLGNLAGIGAGASAFGPVGAVTVPAIGQVSRSLAQKLTSRKGKLLENIIAAGDDGQSIVNAYVKNVPRSSQSSANLAEILIKKNITADEIAKFSNVSKRTKEDVMFYLDQAKKAGQLGVVSAPGAIESTQN